MNERDIVDLVANAPIGIFEMSSEGHLLQANDTLGRMLGYDCGESLVQGISDLARQVHVNPEDQAAWMRLVQERGTVNDFEVQMRRRDGSPRWLSLNLRLHREGSDGSIGIDGFAFDVTERRAVDTALRAEKAFTDKALDAQLDTFFVFEPATGKAVRWNKAFERVSGYSASEIARLPAPDTYYSARDLERAEAFTQAVMEEGEGTLELELVCKDRHRVSTEYRVSVLVGEDGQVEHLISIGRDVSERRRMEKQLRETQLHYTDFVNSSSDLVSYWRMPEGLRIDLPVEEQVEMLLHSVCLEVNRAFWRHLQCESRDGVVGRRFIDLYGGDKARALFRTFIESNYRIENLAFQEVRLEGGETHGLDSWYGSIEDGELTHIWASSKDITEQKLAEAERRDSEVRLRAITEALPDLAFLIDQEGRYMEVLASESDLLYDEASRLKGQLLEEVFPEADARRFLEVIQDTMDTGETQVIEYSLDVPRGRRWFEGRTSLCHSEIDGKPAVVFLSRDISDRRRTEESIRQLVQVSSAQFGDAFFQSMTLELASTLGADFTLIGALDETGTRVRTLAVCADGSPADNFEYDLAGTPCDEVLTKTVCSYSSGVAQLFPDDSMLADMGIDAYVGTPLIRADGSPAGLMVALHRAPLDSTSFAESILQVFSARVGSEMERMDAERALMDHHESLEELVEERTAEVAESEARYRVLVESSPDGILLADPQTRQLTQANSAALALLGYSEEELLRLTVGDAIAPHARERALGEFAAQANGDSSIAYDVPLVCKDGEVVSVDIGGAPVSVKGRLLLLGVLRDVTERKQWETKLREAERRYQTLLDNAPVGIWNASPDGTGQYINPRAVEIMGVSPQAAAEGGWASAIHPEDAERVFVAWTEFVKGRGEYDLRYRFVHEDGEVRWVEGHAQPVRDQEHELLGFIGVLTDITESCRITTELQEHREHLEETVEERTRELLERTTELEHFNRAMVGRENRIIELKVHVNELAMELGHEAPYPRWKAEQT